MIHVTEIYVRIYVTFKVPIKQRFNQKEIFVQHSISKRRDMEVKFRH